MFKKDDYYIYGYVGDKFIIVDFEMLGEIYQDEHEQNIENFINESDEVKLDTFDSYKTDSIYYTGGVEWEEFYKIYKNKWDER